jgi:hypothetical protein
VSLDLLLQAKDLPSCVRGHLFDRVLAKRMEVKRPSSRMARPSPEFVVCRATLR